MSIVGRLGGALGGGIVGTMIAPGPGTLIGAGIGAGIGGGGPKTNKQTSSVQLGPQSSLEELLGGRETLQIDQRRIDELKALQNDIISRVGDKGKKSKQYKEYQKQIDQLMKSPSLKRTGGEIESLYQRLSKDLQAGPDLTRFKQAQEAGTDLEKMLLEYQKTGGLPGQEDITQAGSLAQNLFAARRQALQQDLEDQYTQFEQEMGRRGLMTNDPVARAKMRTGFMRQRDLLGAEQQAQATGIAMGLPGQRVGAATQRYNLLGEMFNAEDALYQRGLSNLQTLIGTGSSLLGQEQNWRYTISPKTQAQTTPGGGFVGGLANTLALGGGIMKTVGMFNQAGGLQGMGLGSFGASPVAAPAAAQPSYSGSYNLGIADQFRR